ncbi:hypothetical protein CS542_05535 [Pedobacter sp. IW39]|nr:hypothetical protein CS542_05535 [Pedobacter sp. IW39]
MYFQDVPLTTITLWLQTTGSAKYKPSPGYRRKIQSTSIYDNDVATDKIVESASQEMKNRGFTCKAITLICSDILR